MPQAIVDPEDLHRFAIEPRERFWVARKDG